LDYVPGPKEPEQAPIWPDYVSGPEYPEYLALLDKEIPVEDQPYAVADSPIALSPGYVADSDPEEDPEEDSKDDPVDYPAFGGDGDDDDSYDDDDEEEEASEEEEDKHLALADFVVAPVVDHVPSFKETEPLRLMKEEVKRLLALPPPPPSPIISLSPPSAKERLARCLAAPALPSSPLPIVPHPYGSPNHVRAPLGFRASMGRLRASSPSTHHPLHPSPPLPPPPSSLHLPPHVPTSLPLPSSPLPPLPASLYEVEESSTAAPRPAGGHGIDYGFIGTLDAETRRQRAKEVGYGIRDVWVDPTEAVEENNMPPRRSSATARAADAAAPMTAAAVEQLIDARVSAALANHKKLFKIELMGTKGVVVLPQWFEKMESVFHISNCAVENQVKFAT
ncbi:hypothetical protein Tco_1187685, partial [Tanacetum coccineum]